MLTQPLVSILVVTYNSGSFVLETLESAKRQTYSNKELIITDDGSIDNTLNLISHWLIENKQFFTRTQLLTTLTNSGISANCNRGVKACKGDWIKLIAGDDILADDCIKKNIDFVNSISSLNPGIVLSRLVYFNDSSNINLNNTFPGLEDSRHSFYSNSITSEKQLYWLMRGKFLPGSAVFYNRKKLNELGNFDERYSMIEDYPTFVKYTFTGNKIYFLNETTVFYRKHDNSITSIKNKRTIPVFFKDVVSIMIEYSKRQKHPILMINSYWNLFWVRLILRMGNRGNLCEFLEWLRLNLQPARVYELNKIKKITAII